MTDRPALPAIALALMLAGTLAGCTRTPAGTAGAQGALEATTTPNVASSATADAASAVLPDGSSGSTKAEVNVLDQQLDAMQKELDSISMPSDSEFNSAEGALY